MIKIFTSFSLFLLGTLAQAQTTNTTQFTNMEIGKNIQVIYTESDTPSVEAADANLVTEIKNGTLRINVAESNNKVYEVRVSGSGVTHIKAWGALTVTNQMSGKEMSLVLENGATFTGNLRPTQNMMLCMGDNTIFNGLVQTQTLDATFAGNAKTSVTGTADVAVVKAHQRSIFLSGNFAAKKMNISAGDYATVKVYAKNDIAINVTKMARVSFTGKPKNVKMNDNAIAFDNRANATAVVAVN